MLGWKPKFPDTRVASVRYRCLNPLAELRSRGFPVELYSERGLPRYSGVIFSKLYDEESQALARRLKAEGRKVVLDICDNHFYNPYRLEQYETVRGQLLRMLALSDLVVASTGELARVLREEAPLSPPPEVVGDAVEEGPRAGWLERARERLFGGGSRRDGKANLIWFGVHGAPNAPCGMLDLVSRRDLLSEIGRRHPLRLLVVSNSREKYEEHIRPFPFETRYLEWGPASLRRALGRSDLNIIPIDRNPFTLCKSNNRLAAALWAGVPTVADGIPSYRDLAPYSVLDDWGRGLLLYLEDPGAGREHVRQARAYIGSRYTIKKIGDRWAEVLSPCL